MLPDSEECAQIVLEVTPSVMRAIRVELRSHRGPDISVPQFRVLLFLNRTANPSLSALAEHIGLTLPSMSKTVDGLVERGLVTRRECAEDRRRVILGLTEEGKSLLEAALAHTKTRLAERVSHLSPQERAEVVAAMQILQAVFTPISSPALPPPENPQ